MPTDAERWQFIEQLGWNWEMHERHPRDFRAPLWEIRSSFYPIGMKYDSLREFVDAAISLKEEQP